MDIKSHSTMIIAMAIAVVIVTGVMVPIISDTLDKAGGGSEDNESATSDSATPINGYWTTVEDKTWDLYVKYISAEEKVGLYLMDPNEEDAEPFFTVAMSENANNPFPVMIGEGWYVSIDYIPDRDWFPNLTIHGINQASMATRHITIEGDTLTYKELHGDIDTVYSATSLLANISDHGNYTSYTNENGPRSILYSVVDYSGDWADGDEYYTAWLCAISNDSEILNTDGHLSIERNGVYTNGDWSYATATSSYVVENGKYTGVNIKGTYDSLYNLDKDFAFGTTYTESDSAYEGIFAFAIGPIDNGSGSGGGFISSSLKAMISAVPIIVMAGLVLVGVGMLRGRA